MITGMALGADLALPPAIQGDVVDVDTWRHGRARAGTFFALWSMATKLALALAVGVALPSLAALGFDATAVDAEGRLVLVVIYAVPAVVLKGLAITLVWGFPLTGAKHAVVRRRRQRRAAANRSAWRPVNVVTFGLGFTVPGDLSGCTTMKPTDFKNATPQLVIEEYFAGETQAWGLFEDRFGTIRRQFSVDIVGTWDGEFLTLDEKFVFEDGERDRRIWKIRKTGDKTYTGTADDVIGEATGRASGNALNWRYQMDLKVGTSTVRVRFDDWMFLQPSGYS